MQRLWIAVGVCLAGAAAVPAFAAPMTPTPQRCATADDLITAPAPLPHLSAALLARRLDVLVVGSATVFGPDAALQPGTVTSQSLVGGRALPQTPPESQTSPPSPMSFPMQMAQALRTSVSGLKTDMVVRGGRGMSATDMLGVLRQELAQRKYQLVIWQTGTVEAVRNVPAGDFYQVLADGAALVQEAGADLVLVDQQYSRFLHANANLDPYTQSMQQIAATPGVLLFRRLEIMRAWVNEGQIDLERTPRGERRAAVETLHACLGQQLARALMTAART